MPYGPGWTDALLDSFFTKVLARLGLPPTRWRLNSFRPMVEIEGTPMWIWNPLDTTQWVADCLSTVDRGYGPGNWNAFGPGNAYHVRIYASEDCGVKATYRTLINGQYNDWISVLAAQAWNEAARDDLQKWGWSDDHINTIISRWGPSPGPEPVEDDMFEQTDRDALNVLVADVATLTRKVLAIAQMVTTSDGPGYWVKDIDTSTIYRVVAEGGMLVRQADPGWPGFSPAFAAGAAGIKWPSVEMHTEELEAFTVAGPPRPGP